MERRIKLSDDDLAMIADSLSCTHSSAIRTKRDLAESEMAEQIAFIERVAMLEDEFRSRIEEDEENDDPVPGDEDYSCPNCGWSDELENGRCSNCGHDC